MTADGAAATLRIFLAAAPTSNASTAIAIKLIFLGS
jgi:hypothetical protein